MGLDRRGLLTAGLVLVLGGCATRGGGMILRTSPGREAGELEALRGATAGPAGISLRVASRGCTTKDDFSFYVGREGGELTLAFARKRLDVCKAAPSVAEVSFSYEELGLSATREVRLLNAVAGDGGPGPPR
jgi:hypothetical protein